MGIGFDIPISENALAQLDAGICSMEKLMGCFCELEVDIVNENPFIT
jgi:hypothetical protein